MWNCSDGTWRDTRRHIQRHDLGTRWTLVCRHSAIKGTFCSSWYGNRKGQEDISWQFFPVIGLKLNGRNCETIKCFFFFFFYQRGTVWRRFRGGLPPLLPATIFPSAFHSFCLSHFSINLHNLTLFIESGWCLLHRTNKMLPFSLPHNNLFFFSVFSSYPSWRWYFSPGCWASQCLAGFSRHEAVCVRLKRGNLWRAGRAL